GAAKPDARGPNDDQIAHQAQQIIESERAAAPQMAALRMRVRRAENDPREQGDRAGEKPGEAVL
ncbi:MAG: hypothetical protein H7124_10210, partial [Phycisphaerales bacterium]|nr:hypothetical protein [Hyphomonadaceae bacterium]